jgi:uroporphyrinogen-III synthase
MTPSRPLEGRRVVVTRGRDKTDHLPALLAEAGATVVPVPLIAPLALVDADVLRSAVARLRGEGGGSPPWLVLTSERAALMVAAAVSPTDMAGITVGVVGPATAAAVRAVGLEAHLTAPGQEAESLAAAVAEAGVEGARVLVIAAAGGRDVVAPALSAAGGLVEVVEAYRTVMPDGAAARLRTAFDEATVDAITFTSGSTVRHAAVALPLPPPACVAACIGTVTAGAARDSGWTQVVVASEHTAAGVVAVLIDRFNAAHPLP